MTSGKKILITATVGIGVIGVISYLSGLSRTKAELETITKGMIHSLTLDGLTVRIDVQLKNPTGGSLKIKYPFVKLYSKPNEKEKEKAKPDLLGSSKVINKDITIKPYGEAVISGIMFNIPTVKLLSLAGGVYNLLKQKQPIALNVTTISTIDLGWKKIAYSQTDPITLNPKTT